MSQVPREIAVDLKAGFPEEKLLLRALEKDDKALVVEVLQRIYQGINAEMAIDLICKGRAYELLNKAIKARIARLIRARLLELEIK